MGSGHLGFLSNLRVRVLFFSRSQDGFSCRDRGVSPAFHGICGQKFARVITPAAPYGTVVKVKVNMDLYSASS